LRTYKVKGVEHFVYDIEAELPGDLVLWDDWKTASAGDWVKTDDGAYIQILEVKKIGTTSVAVTCIGTYSVGGKMDTAERSSRYTLNGKDDIELLLTREKPTGREIMFAKRVALGESPLEAYLSVFRAINRQYAAERAAILIKTERVQKIMTEDTKDVFKRLKIDMEYLISKAKEEVENSKNGSDRISGLKMLWDAFGVVQAQNRTETIGVAWSREKLKEIERPELNE